MMNPEVTLRTITLSLGKDDLFVLSRKLDTPQARRFFDFSGAAKDGKLVDKERFMLDALNIDDSLYTVEQIFDAEQRRRVIQARLKVDISITFKVNEKYRTIQLRKGEVIMVWHAYHNNLLEVAKQLDGSGFDILQLMKSRDQQYLQVIAKIKTEEV